MNEHSIVLLVCLVVIVILATLLCAAGWGYLAASQSSDNSVPCSVRSWHTPTTWTCRCASSAAFSTMPTRESAL
jgi:hypothetical protein